MTFTFISRSAFHVFILCIATLGTGYSVVYGHAQDNIPIIRQEAVKKDIAETVTIGNNSFVIPEPWAGSRIIPPKFTIGDFRKIPSKHCKNNSKIYILAKAHKPLLELLAAALKDGILLQVESGYRSLGYQKAIFIKKMKQGRTFEDIIRYVAPPGYSQHMLGIAVDFAPSNWEFASTPQYKWLQENGHKYQFVETYPEFNLQKVPWEAWHWAYTEKVSQKSEHPEVPNAHNSSSQSPSPLP